MAGKVERPWLEEKISEDRFLRRGGYVIRDRPNFGPNMWSLGKYGAKVMQQAAIEEIVSRSKKK